MSKMSMATARVVYVVATPLGHLQDLTPRAREVLSTVDVICAEDTRALMKLLQLTGIRAVGMIKSYHQHNEKAVCAWLKESSWTSLALVSDAGTPNIHDPGQMLMRQAWHEGWQLVPVPGACALSAALSVCDMPTNPMLFVGFLPAKASQRRAALSDLRDQKALMAFYESPHRIQDFFKDAADVLGDRTVWVAREMTKKHEQIIRASASEACAMIDCGQLPARGEFVVLIEGGSSQSSRQDQWQHAVKDLSMHLTDRQVIHYAQTHLGVRKNEVYRYLKSLHDVK